MNFMTSKQLCLYKGFCFLIFSIIFLEDLKSQCNPPTELPNVQCSEATVTCLQDACFETTNQVDVGWLGFCGINTQIHNPQYFEIIPVDPCISILIHVDGCSSGQTALQAALVTSCDWQPCPGSIVPCADILDCDPGTPPGGTMIIEACGLTPGVSLWLLIDGSNGSTCGYTISLAEGIFQPQIDEEIIDGAASSSSVCQGFDNLEFSVSPVIGAHGYLWDLGWSGEMVTSTISQLQIDIPNDAPVGSWNVCVVGFSGCDTTEIPYCIPLTIYENIADVTKAPEAFCPEEFPFTWHDQTITGPGIYQQSFLDPDGCAYDSIWQVDEFPEVPVGELHIVHCFNENFDPFIYEGEVYDNPGVYDLVYPEMGLNGCDSFAELHLTMKGFELFIENNCVGDQSFLSPHIIEIVPANDSLYYEWFDCGFVQLLSTEKFFEPDSAGCYCLIATSGICSDTICSTYVGDPCGSGCSIVTEEACIGDSVLLSFDAADSLNLTFHWLIEAEGRTESYVTGNDSIWVTYDSAGCYRVSLTIVDDTSSVTCIDSVCILSGQSTAALCCSGVLCGLPCAPLIIELTGSPPWTVMISDGNTIDTVSGILASPFLYEACELDSGTHHFSIIEVLGFEDLCPGQVVGDSLVTVAVEFPLEPLEILVSENFLCATYTMVSYSWFECDSSEILGTSQCFNPAATGCYCVEVTTDAGCETFECIDFIVSTEKPEAKTNVSIIPNPSNGIINIKLGDETSYPVQWKLFNQLGIAYQRGIITEVNSQLDFGKEIPAGVYFIQLSSGERQLGIKKIIIE